MTAARQQAQLPLIPPPSVLASWLRVRATALQMLRGEASASDVIAEQERHVRVWEAAQNEAGMWV